MDHHAMLGSDPDAVKDSKLERALMRRVWQLAQRYRIMLVGFLVTIALDTIVGIGPPLLIKRILDEIGGGRNERLVTTLGMLMIGLAFVEALLSLAQRWWSARIGEGLIFDLRVALFDHVQRMPIAFFTRTQTGALVSRMNNDVIGAQRALTGTLGTVVSNVVTLVVTLAAMAYLEWRLTLLTVVLLPVFILPAKRVGRRLQAITREGMNLNAEMNTTMTERFNVSGALLVKLFGRHDEEASAFAEPRRTGPRHRGAQRHVSAASSSLRSRSSARSAPRPST